MLDLMGQRFTRLVVTGQAPNHISAGGTVFRQWKVRCDCGAKFEVRSNLLRSGKAKSCGCLSIERLEREIEGLRARQQERVNAVD